MGQPVESFHRAVMDVVAEVGGYETISERQMHLHLFTIWIENNPKHIWRSSH